VPFSRTLYIERDDFREDPPREFFRLAPGREVRLKHAYLVRCTRVVKDGTTGEVVELHCEHDPASRGGEAPDGRKVKGTLHWVSADHAATAEVRLLDYLLLEEDPSAPAADFAQRLNPASLVTLTGCRVEPSLARAAPGERFQFLRHGYFCVDTKDSRPGAPVFNRTVSLKDTWAKIEKALPKR
jgi:glutaminyl-tRNA synthetase